MARKKLIETHYVEEARRASSVFPPGTPKPHEIPDFLLLTGSSKLGIEVTELCREDPRAEAGRLLKIPDNAKEIYTSYPQAEPGVATTSLFMSSTQFQADECGAHMKDNVYATREPRIPSPDPDSAANP